MRGTAATVGITDHGEINVIARKSTNHCFLASVGKPLTYWNQTEGYDGPLVRHRDCALLRRGSERMEL